MDVNDYIHNNFLKCRKSNSISEHSQFLKIIVKTNSDETEVTGYDEARKAVKLNVASPPIEGKANIEIIKFFKKKYKLNVEIKSGKTGKEKLLRII